jgi:hypothetical protein
VAQWLQSKADVVISVGPIFDKFESAALFDPLPRGARVLRILIDAPVDNLRQGAG